MSHPVNIYGCRRPATVGSLLIVIGGMLSCFSPSLAWMYVLKGIIPGQSTLFSLSSSVLFDVSMVEDYG